MEILAATNNAHKLFELKQLLAALGISVRGAEDVGGIPEVDEDAPTFKGNALKKAISAAQHANCVALADDSGLEVFSLNRDPGVMSARYAGTHGDDVANIAKVLDALEDCEDRRARFVCAIAVARPNGQADVVEGDVYGTITHKPRGDRGFGYDPIFIPDGDDRTFGEFTPAEKDKISHRSAALRAATACKLFESVLGQPSSADLFERAIAVIPGGVNSPVRAFGSVGGEPLYVKSGTGARFESVEGTQFLDFCCSWGPLILGHAHPEVVDAVQRASEAGLVLRSKHARRSRDRRDYFAACAGDGDGASGELGDRGHDDGAALGPRGYGAAEDDQV